MRLFTAVYPEPEIIEAIAERIPPGFRHAPPDRWHITLSFHADCPSGRLEELENALSDAFATVVPFELRLDGTGRFGPISWLGLAGEVETLGLLAVAARHAAKSVHVDTDAKAYAPHLTLSRDEGALADAMFGWRSEPWMVEEVHLVHSRIDGPTRHDVIGTWSLGD